MKSRQRRQLEDLMTDLAELNYPCLTRDDLEEDYMQPTDQLENSKPIHSEKQQKLK